MPVLAQLNTLWREVVERRLFKLRYFLLDLYLHSKYDLRLIAPEKVQLKIDPLEVPDCSACPRNCCCGAENTVSLRLTDIARLMDAGLEEYIDKDNKVNIEREILEKHPGITRNIQSDTWRKFPVLKRVNDICPLLSKDKKCTIYNVRPLTCRRYPYMLMDNMKEVRFSRHCINPKTIKDLDVYAREHFDSAIASYNEKVKDLILIHHARKELAELGIGKYLVL
jgi:Fe-S-cluster containining protein